MELTPSSAAVIAVHDAYSAADPAAHDVSIASLSLPAGIITSVEVIEALMGAA
jgi:hypothetical protein